MTQSKKKKSADEGEFLGTGSAKQQQNLCSRGGKVDVEKQNFREGSSVSTQAEKKREPIATSPSIHWPWLFHAVVGL